MPDLKEVIRTSPIEIHPERFAVIKPKLPIR